MQFLAVETIYCLIFCENEAVKVRKQRVAMVLLHVSGDILYAGMLEESLQKYAGWRFFWLEADAFVSCFSWTERLFCT